jgi:SulP family sulfate permease
MRDSLQLRESATWFWWFPPVRWLRDYRAAWLPGDIVAGITLAAYAIPVSLAYAGLAGLPPQVGLYGYLLGGLGYALLGSSRQLAIGPTSAISLMIAGTVGAMAEGDAQRYAQIASLAAFTVAVLCLLAWVLRLSALVKLISDSILVGFKIGAGLTIAVTQLPSLLGVAGGGHNFFECVVLLAGQLSQMQYFVLAVGGIAIMLLVFGERLLPGKPVALGVVALAIAATTALGLPALGVPTIGEIPAGLPTFAVQSSGCAMLRESSHWRLVVCSWPTSKACRQPARLLQSTDTFWTLGKSFSALAPPISRRRWDTATPWQADCRKPR